MTRKILLALSLVAIAGGPALAATGSEVDANGDGTISAEEAQAVGIDITTITDDGDGVITVDEYDTFMMPPAQ